MDVKETLLRQRAIAVLCLIALVTACGEDGASDGSSDDVGGESKQGSEVMCTEFLGWTAQDRDELVRDLAVDLAVPDATSPLGRPNVEYYCTQDPTMTVAASIQLIGGEDDTFATPSPTAVSLEGPATSGHISLVDDNGYTFELDFEASLGAATADPTNSLPGMTEVALPYSVSYTVTNTTSQRTAPLDVLEATQYGGTHVQLAPAWSKNSAACSSLGATEPLLFEVVGTPGMSSRSLPYCTLPILHVFSSMSESELAADASISDTVSDTLLFDAEEASAEAVIDALASEPVTWLVEIPGSASDCYWDWAANDTVLCNGGDVAVG